MAYIAIEWTFGRPNTGADQDEARAAGAAEQVLDAADVNYAEAEAEYQRQWLEFDDEAPMTGLALTWIEARRAADLALTEGWYNADGASCSIVAGWIVTKKLGRPAKADTDKAVRINITLTPEAIAALDALGGTRSGTIERLITNGGHHTSSAYKGQQRRRHPMTRQINAWIETIKTFRGTRYIVVEEGILFAGRRNQVCTSWADRRGAREYIRRNDRVLQPGACPLPPVSAEERAAYHADGEARRARVAAKAAA